MAGDELSAHGAARRRSAQQRSSTTVFNDRDDSYLRRASVSMALDGDRFTDRLEWDRQQVIKVLKVRGNNSFLRGWRLELDLDGALYVSFQDFCRAAARLGFAVDARGLFSLDDDEKNLDLQELAPSYGALVKSFLTWVSQKLGGPGKMMSLFDKSGSGRLSLESFTKGCQSYGFEGDDEDLAELFRFCDLNNGQSIRPEDVFIFEADPHTRQLEAFKMRTRMSDKDVRQRVLATVYSEEKRCTLPRKHRLAPRPWLAPEFDRLPTVIRQRRSEHRHFVVRRAMHARTLFLRHLREKFGNATRGWRCGLDPEESFGITQTTLRAYCRKVNLNVDMGSLWKALDKDNDMTLEFHELCPKAGNVMAQFQSWAFDFLGSCAAIWDAPETLAARCRPARNGSWASDKKMLFATFAEALKALGWKPISDPEIRGLLFSSLDKYGCGFVSFADLVWVDRFYPPEWLGAQPDEEAWEDLRDVMLEKFIHPLQAWRMLLDRDDSNHISWGEFRSACDALKWDGNVAGAWRFLDKDISGTISLKEFDTESHELLASFRDWCDSNWGSVKLTFKALDADGSNTLSYTELKRACSKYPWDGEVRLIFDCLDIDQKKDPKGSGNDGAGKRAISVEELLFLDSWQIDPHDEEIKEDEAILENASVYMSPTATFRGNYAGSEGPSRPTSPTSSTVLRPETSAGPTCGSSSSRPASVTKLKKPHTSDGRIRQPTAWRGAHPRTPMRRTPPRELFPLPDFHRDIGTEYKRSGYAGAVGDDTEHFARMQQIEAFLEREERLLAKSASAPYMGIAGGGPLLWQQKRPFLRSVTSPVALAH